MTCGFVVARGGVEPPTFRFSGGDGDLFAAEARVKGGVNQEHLGLTLCRRVVPKMFP